MTLFSSSGYLLLLIHQQRLLMRPFLATIEYQLSLTFDKVYDWLNRRLLCDSSRAFWRPLRQAWLLSAALSVILCAQDASDAPMLLLNAGAKFEAMGACLLLPRSKADKMVDRWERSLALESTSWSSIKRSYTVHQKVGFVNYNFTWYGMSLWDLQSGSREHV